MVNNEVKCSYQLSNQYLIDSLLTNHNKLNYSLLETK